MSDSDRAEHLAATIAHIRKALAMWDAGYRLNLSGSDVETLLEAYDQIKGKEVLK